MNTKWIEAKQGEQSIETPLDRLKTHRLVYVASPYSKYPLGIEEAFMTVSGLTASLIEKGVKAYSPIAHTHPIAIHGCLDPLNHDFWLPFDQTMIDLSDALVVCTMEGWQHSKGVRYEINEFRKPFGYNHGHVAYDGYTTRPSRPVYYLDPITMEVL
jgi:hypothetical protein